MSVSVLHHHSLFADLQVFLVVKVVAKAEVLQVDGLVFAFVWEPSHLLRGRNLDRGKNHRERRLSCGFYLRFVTRTAQGLCSYRWGSVVQGNEARRSVSQHGKVGCGRGSHGQRATVGVHLVVHQTPLLQEGVDPEDRETPAESVF